MPEKMTAPLLYLGCFVLASVGGLVALLRSEHELSPRNVLTVMLHGGMWGLTIGMLMYTHLGGENADVHFMLGVSGLSGLGGANFCERLVQWISKGGRKFGFRVTITPDSPDEE